MNAATTDERTIRLTIEYDGTAFHGWQVQPETRTVQGDIESALSLLLHHEVRLIAAGRTDAGVHARGQVAHFTTTSDFPISRLAHALNGNLDKDVVIRDAAYAPTGFNARYDARARTYTYTISTRQRAFGRAYSWYTRAELDTKLLEAATEPLIGECDLRAFSKGADEDDYSTIIFKNGWTFENNFMIFEIQGIRFFHHAVRSIVGTAVDVARGALPVDIVRRMLETRDRSLAGVTAPARGLCLEHVDYEHTQK